MGIFHVYMDTSEEGGGEEEEVVCIPLTGTGPDFQKIPSIKTIESEKD